MAGQELPPRARRIQTAGTKRFFDDGTTSACAENTFVTVVLFSRVAELPPRARRILACSAVLLQTSGTTSACAENTSQTGPGQNAPGNYLRVRGEYGPPTKKPHQGRELPPRARRILTHFLIEAQAHGTTSACAENTTRHHRGPDP